MIKQNLQRHTMDVSLHKGDLPKDITFSGSIAVDTEAMGLNPHRDRLCVVQISGGNGVCYLVQLEKGKEHQATHLKSVLADPTIEKIFHYGRFDIAMIYHYLGVLCTPVYCTKIASKMARTFVGRHGLKDLVRDLLAKEISKEMQVSDWGAATLNERQCQYAATDVLYLHELKEKLNTLLVREGRLELAQQCFGFLPTVAKLDLLGYDGLSIFNHS